jgi:hypothetical protein
MAGWDDATTVTTETIGEAWLEVAADILDRGRVSTYDGLPILEIAQATLDVARPDPDDALIARLADPERLDWMQVDWVVERLAADPSSRSATITTFEPVIDTSYIPCVSMLDFWIPDHALDLVVYAHSIDFGAKGYANLVQLAELQRHIAERLGRGVGRLTFVVKSAHVYDTEGAWMRSVLAQAASR